MPKKRNKNPILWKSSLKGDNTVKLNEKLQEKLSMQRSDLNRLEKTELLTVVDSLMLEAGKGQELLDMSTAQKKVIEKVIDNNIGVAEQRVHWKNIKVKEYAADVAIEIAEDLLPARRRLYDEAVESVSSNLAFLDTQIEAIEASKDDPAVKAAKIADINQQKLDMNEYLSKSIKQYEGTAFKFINSTVTKEATRNTLIQVNTDSNEKKDVKDYVIPGTSNKNATDVEIAEMINID